jgi:hypothetical protein
MMRPIHDFTEAGNLIGDIQAALQNCRIGNVYPMPENFLFDLCAHAHKQWYIEQNTKTHELIMQNAKGTQPAFEGIWDKILSNIKP